jgi:hypothetical protein
MTLVTGSPIKTRFRTVDALSIHYAESEHELLDANHFVWADGADDYASQVINWWQGGYQRPQARVIA